MKVFLSLLGFSLLSINVLNAQEFSTNRNPVGLEYNILFNSDTRYTVSQTGSAAFDLSRLFDGKLNPSYTRASPSDLDPTVVLIEGLPDIHIQAGAWIGWTTRYWYPRRFKIEGYDSYNESNSWKVVVDYSTQNYTGSNDLSVALPDGSFTKLRFTFYEATGTNGRMGLSEIYFIHPEATSPYGSLLGVGASGLWNDTGSDINYTDGNVGIGTSTPIAKLEVNGSSMKIGGSYTQTNLRIEATDDTGAPAKVVGIELHGYGDRGKGIYITDKNKDDKWFMGEGYDYQGIGIGYSTSDRTEYGINTKLFIGTSGNVGIGTMDPDVYKLAVKGKIRAEEIRVETGWADYVFTEDYTLPTLEEVEKHIMEKGHLINIPSASEVEANGIEIGRMNKLLLEKIEELTLYILQQEERIRTLEDHF